MRFDHGSLELHRSHHLKFVAVSCWHMNQRHCLAAATSLAGLIQLLQIHFLVRENFGGSGC